MIFITYGRCVPVDAAHGVTHATAKACHDGECAESPCVVLGLRHVQQIGPGRTLTCVRVEI